MAPRVCATCRYMRIIGSEGVIVCRRDGWEMDTGDRDDIITTCDGWRNGTVIGRDAWAAPESQPCPKCKGTGYRYNRYGEMAECMDCDARGEVQP